MRFDRTPEKLFRMKAHRKQVASLVRPTTAALASGAPETTAAGALASEALAAAEGHSPVRNGRSHLESCFQSAWLRAMEFFYQMWVPHRYCRLYSRTRHQNLRPLRTARGGFPNLGGEGRAVTDLIKTRDPPQIHLIWLTPGRHLPSALAAELILSRGGSLPSG